MDPSESVCFNDQSTLLGVICIEIVIWFQRPIAVSFYIQFRHSLLYPISYRSYRQGRTGPAVNWTGAPFTNSYFGAPKNSKVRLDLFAYNPKNNVHIS